MKQNKTIKLLKVLFEFIFTINGPKNAIIISMIFPMIFRGACRIGFADEEQPSHNEGTNLDLARVQGASWRLTGWQPRLAGSPSGGGGMAGWPKNGVYRAPNTAKKKMVFCFSCFFNVILGFKGVLIIPKWRINDS